MASGSARPQSKRYIGSSHSGDSPFPPLTPTNTIRTPNHFHFFIKNSKCLHPRIRLDRWEGRGKRKPLIDLVRWEGRGEGEGEEGEGEEGEGEEEGEEGEESSRVIKVPRMGLDRWGERGKERRRQWR